MSYPSGERLCLLLWRDALKQPKQNEIIIVIEVPHYTYILNQNVNGELLWNKTKVTGERHKICF